MATKIYETGTVELIDGTIIELSPLKIKHLRKFMTMFEDVKSAQTDAEAVEYLSKCAMIAMKQFLPNMSEEDLEDNLDLYTVYDILSITAGIKINPEDQEEVKEQAESSGGATWDSLDLAKLESEVFLLGIWKDYEELESSMSMPEIIATIGSKRELDHEEKKFLAAMQGVDLDGDSKQSEPDPWEAMKARVFSGGRTDNPNDIVAYQGVTASKAGFGIGMGLDYEDLR